MFESEPTVDEPELSHSVTRVFKHKEEVSLQTWADHFSQPLKNQNKSLTNLLELEFVIMKRKYCFLEKSQIMGRILTALGIPNICGDVSKSFLQQFKTSKGRIKRLEKPTKPRGTGLVGLPRNKVLRGNNIKKIPRPRYPPVAERWSDAAIKKFKENKDVSNDQAYTFENNGNVTCKSSSVNKSFFNIKKVGQVSGKSTKEPRQTEKIQNKPNISNCNTNLKSNIDESLDKPPQNNQIHVRKIEKSIEINSKTNQNTAALQIQQNVESFLYNQKTDETSDKTIDKNDKPKIPHTVKKSKREVLSDNWSTTVVINEPLCAKANIQHEVMKKSLKKTVTFNDHLCFYAPSPDYSESPEELSSEANKIMLSQYKNSAPDCLESPKELSLETNKITILSEYEHIFDEIIKNSEGSSTNSTKESETNRTPAEIKTKQYTNTDTDIFKPNEPKVSTLSQFYTNKKQSLAKNQNSCPLKENKNCNQIKVNESCSEVEPYHESDIVIEVTSPFSTSERYDKAKNEFDGTTENITSLHPCFQIGMLIKETPSCSEENGYKTSALQLTEIKSTLKGSKEHSTQNSTNDTVVKKDQNKMSQEFCAEVDPDDYTPLSDSSHEPIGPHVEAEFVKGTQSQKKHQNSVSLICSKNGTIIEETPSSSEDIAREAPTTYTVHETNQAFEVSKEQDIAKKDTYETNSLKYKNKFPEDICTEEDSDEYIVLSDNKETQEFKSKSECYKENKSQITPQNFVSSLNNGIVIEETPSSSEDIVLNTPTDLTNNTKLLCKVDTNKIITADTTNNSGYLVTTQSETESGGVKQFQVLTFERTPFNKKYLSNNKDDKSIAPQTKNSQSRNINDANGTFNANLKEDGNKIWIPEEDSDEEYIPLSNCDSLKSNSGTKWEEGSKQILLLENSNSLNDMSQVLEKADTTAATDLKQNNCFRQRLENLEIKAVTTQSPSKKAFFNIPQNLSPTGSLSDREYLSDSSQCDSIVMSNIIAENKDIPNTVKNQDYNTKKYVKSSKQENISKTNTTKENYLKSYDEVEGQNKLQNFNMSDYGSRSKTILTSESSLSVQILDLPRKVPVDLSTPQCSELSQDGCFRRESMTLEITNAPVKNFETNVEATLTKTNKVNEISNNSLSKLSTSVCKTLFPIDNENVNLDQYSDTNSNSTKRGCFYECASPIKNLFEAKNGSSREGYNQNEITENSNLEMEHKTIPTASNDCKTNQSKVPSTPLKNKNQGIASILSLDQNPTHVLGSDKAPINKEGIIKCWQGLHSSRECQYFLRSFPNEQKDGCDDSESAKVEEVMITNTLRVDLDSNTFLNKDFELPSIPIELKADFHDTVTVQPGLANTQCSKKTINTKESIQNNHNLVTREKSNSPNGHFPYRENCGVSKLDLTNAHEETNALTDSMDSDASSDKYFAESPLPRDSKNVGSESEHVFDNNRRNTKAHSYLENISNNSIENNSTELSLRNNIRATEEIITNEIESSQSKSISKTGNSQMKTTDSNKIELPSLRNSFLTPKSCSEIIFPTEENGNENENCFGVDIQIVRNALLGKVIEFSQPRKPNTEQNMVHSTTGNNDPEKNYSHKSIDSNQNMNSQLKLSNTNIKEIETQTKSISILNNGIKINETYYSHTPGASLDLQSAPMRNKLEKYSGIVNETLETRRSKATSSSQSKQHFYKNTYSNSVSSSINSVSLKKIPENCVSDNINKFINKNKFNQDTQLADNSQYNNDTSQTDKPSFKKYYSTLNNFEICNKATHIDYNHKSISKVISNSDETVMSKIYSNNGLKTSDITELHFEPEVLDGPKSIFFQSVQQKNKLTGHSKQTSKLHPQQFSNDNRTQASIYLVDKFDKRSFITKSPCKLDQRKISTNACDKTIIGVSHNTKDITAKTNSGTKVILCSTKESDPIIINDHSKIRCKKYIESNSPVIFSKINKDNSTLLNGNKRGTLNYSTSLRTPIFKDKLESKQNAPNQSLSKKSQVFKRNRVANRRATYSFPRSPENDIINKNSIKENIHPRFAGSNLPVVLKGGNSKSEMFRGSQLSNNAELDLSAKYKEMQNSKENLSYSQNKNNVINIVDLQENINPQFKTQLAAHGNDWSTTILTNKSTPSVSKEKHNSTSNDKSYPSTLTLKQDTYEGKKNVKSRAFQGKTNRVSHQSSIIDSSKSYLIKTNDKISSGEIDSKHIISNVHNRKNSCFNENNLTQFLNSDSNNSNPDFSPESVGKGSVNDLSSPKGDISFLDFYKQNKVPFDIFGDYIENSSSQECRKRKYNSLEGPSCHKRKQQKHSMISTQNNVDLDDDRLLRAKESDSENTLDFKRNLFDQNEGDLSSVEPELENDAFNSHLESHNALSVLHSSDSFIQNSQVVSDQFSLKTDSDYPSISDGELIHFSQMEKNIDCDDSDYLTNMFDAYDSDSARSWSPGQSD